MTTLGRSHIRWFRNTAPYINAHRGKTFVLMLGGDAACHENFPNIIHDIALLSSLGIKLVLVHGSEIKPTNGYWKPAWQQLFLTVCESLIPPL